MAGKKMTDKKIGLQGLFLSGIFAFDMSAALFARLTPAIIRARFISRKRLA